MPAPPATHGKNRSSRTRKFVEVTVVSAALLGLTSGCDSLTIPSRSTQDLSETSPTSGLLLGMTAAEVRDIIGRPDAISPLPAGGPVGETWHYQRKISEAIRQVPIGTRDLPAVNPITGQDIVVKEPILTNEVSTIYENIRLILVGGKLVDISRHPEYKRTME